MIEDIVTPAKATLMSTGQLQGQYGVDGNVMIPGVVRSANGEWSDDLIGDLISDLIGYQIGNLINWSQSDHLMV